MFCLVFSFCKILSWNHWIHSTGAPHSPSTPHNREFTAVPLVTYFCQQPHYCWEQWCRHCNRPHISDCSDFINHLLWATWTFLLWIFFQTPLALLEMPNPFVPYILIRVQLCGRRLSPIMAYLHENVFSCHTHIQNFHVHLLNKL